MASILITMVTMIIVSLIVLGFATISRREQGNTLDQQLSTQAFYAAESGINDARQVILDAVQHNQPVPGKKKCATYGPWDINYNANYTYPTGSATVLDGTHDVSYTCLLVYPYSTSTLPKSVGGQATIVPIDATQSIDSLVVTWTPTGNPSGSPARCPSTLDMLPTVPWLCGYGLLRMDLVPMRGTLTRSGLARSDLTAFFEPLKTDPGTKPLSYTRGVGRPNVAAASCGTSTYTHCSVRIDQLPPGLKDVSLRLSSLYQPSDVTVTAYNASTPIPVAGQVIIDVTGRAGGVLRRIEVSVPVSGQNVVTPDDAVESNGSICKHYMTSQGFFSIPADIVSPDSAPMCEPRTVGNPN